MHGRGRLYRALNVNYVILVIFIAFLLIRNMENIEFSAGMMSDFGLLLSIVYDLESKLFWFMLNIFLSCDGLFYAMLGPKYTLASLFSFGMMFTLTSYLVLLTLRLNRKRVVRRCRVSSCIWTRRKVFWLQKGKTRSAYILDALENSIKARVHCGKEARERTEKFSCVSCCNILKLSILILIAALACAKAQIFNELQRHKTNT